MATSKFLIPTDNLPTLRSKLEKLGRKAATLGCEPVTMIEVGECWARESLGGGRTIIRTYQAIEVAGEAPSYGGWALAATVLNGAFLGDAVGAVVKTAGQVEVPEHLRAGTIEPSYCGHCHNRRRRKETFLCRHENGRWVQVGRQCLRDFLGHQHPEQFAKAAEAIYEAFGACEDAEGSVGGERSRMVDLMPFLATVIAVVRECGYRGRSRARDAAWGAPPTANVALEELFRGKHAEALYPVTPEDWARAERLRIWADGWLASPTGDYQLNLAAAYGSGQVSHRTAGLVASLVMAWQRETEQQIQRARRPGSEHVGAVKQRLEMRLTLARVHHWESDWGTTALHRFVDQEGNTVVWKTGKTLLDVEGQEVETGDTILVKCTVKDHGEYKGEKQTRVSRLVALSAAAPQARGAA